MHENTNFISTLSFSYIMPASRSRPSLPLSLCWPLSPEINFAYLETSVPFASDFFHAASHLLDWSVLCVVMVWFIGWLHFHCCFQLCEYPYCLISSHWGWHLDVSCWWIRTLIAQGFMVGNEIAGPICILSFSRYCDMVFQSGCTSYCTDPTPWVRESPSCSTSSCKMFEW